jgi:hypothetical protein
MRILAGVVLALLFAAPANACTKLPAKSGTDVPISASNAGETKRTAVRVCGRTLATATLTGSGTRHKDGARLGEASAAGHRVAWIEERHSNGLRTAIVTLADARRGVLRRFVVRRDRSRLRSQIHVLLTRRGDLAWTAGTAGKRGDVMVKQPGKPRKRLSRYSAYGLGLEDGRTLLWGDFSDLGFYDLRHKRCPSRSGYKAYRRDTGRVKITYKVYDLASIDGPFTVLRGCDTQTGHDRVLLVTPIAPDAGPPDETLYISGADRTWVVMYTESYTPYFTGPWDLTAVDVVSGRAVHGPVKPTDADPPGRGLAVTDQGVIAWRDDDVLYALVKGSVTELDRGGVLTDPHAQSDAVTWTHDGAPRSFRPRD